MTDTGTSGAMAQARRDSEANFSDQPVGSACQSCPAPHQDEIKTSLGAELSGVRVNDGVKAQKSSDSLGADGFTKGSSTTFGSNTADPQTLPHETAHTVPQDADTFKPE